MRTIQSRWTFHRAGQGCFYTGLIKAPSEEIFSFVFDCGSIKGAGILREEIDDFKMKLKKLGKMEIDLLVISHYDADHINQLPSLLKNFRCKLVVLPYLSNFQRLFVYSNQRLNDATDSVDYLNFIIDPFSYLNQLGVEKVIFIDGNNESLVDNAILRPDNPNEPINDFIQFQIINDLAVHNEPEIKGELNPTFKKFLGDTCELRKGNGKIIVGHYWEFYFYEQEYPKDLINHYRKFIERTFGIQISSKGLTDTQLSNLVKDRRLRKQLKESHEYFFGDSNDTGLIVQHGPIGQRHIESFTTKILYSEASCFTLLNGDCSLSKVKFPDYIKSTSNYIRFFQVPHHGSQLSWETGLWKFGLDRSHMIVNYGTNNRFNHPHAGVVDYIKSRANSWKLKHNTEKKKFTYHIRSYIK